MSTDTSAAATATNTTNTTNTVTTTATTATTIVVPTVSRDETVSTAKGGSAKFLRAHPRDAEDDASGSSEAMVSATPPRRCSTASSSCDDDEDEATHDDEGQDGASKSTSGEATVPAAGRKKKAASVAEKPPVHPRARKPSAEERASDATVLVNSWLSDLVGVSRMMSALQADVTARGAVNECPASLAAAHKDLVRLCNNLHIVAHNFLNAVIPALPEQQVHEIGSLHEHSAIIGTFQQVIDTAERHMDAYVSFARRLAEIADLERPMVSVAQGHAAPGEGPTPGPASVVTATRNPHAAAAVDAACFTAHYSLLKSLRAVACQVNILAAALERRAERLTALLAGKRERSRHQALYF
jgi:hypothetical protein